jgi:hypothetical protein
MDQPCGLVDPAMWATPSCNQGPAVLAAATAAQITTKPIRTQVIPGVRELDERSDANGSRAEPECLLMNFLLKLFLPLVAGTGAASLSAVENRRRSHPPPPGAGRVRVDASNRVIKENSPISAEIDRVGVIFGIFHVVFQ